MSIAEYVYTEILKPRPLRALTNSILLRIIRETLQVGPAVVHLNSNDPVVSGALTLRVFEPSELSFFQKYCRGEKNLVDIGANVGLYTALAMHSLSPAAQIIALEPHPENFAYLNKTIAGNLSLKSNCPRTEAFNLAASAEPGTIELFMNPDNRGDNRTYATNDGQWKSIPVEAQPVDALLERAQVQQINFVKMDVQGYEHAVLRGFKRMLARSREVILMTEFWPKGLKEAGSNGAAYLEDLSCLGFTLYELKERPRGKVVPLENWEKLIGRLPGRKYTNIIGVKGYSLP